MDSLIFIGTCYVTLTGQLFISCFFANMVKAKSELLSIEIYQSNWVEQTKTFKNNLKILLECSQRPIVITTSNGILEISLPTFVQVPLLQLLLY